MTTVGEKLRYCINLNREKMLGAEYDDHVAKLYEKLKLDHKNHMREVKLDALNCILANLLQSKDFGIPLRYSRNKNDYFLGRRYGKRFWSHLFITSLVDALSDFGLAENKIGYYNDPESRISRLLPTDAIYDLVGTDALFHLKREPLDDVIRLKDGEKRIIDYQDNATTIRMRNNLEIYNKSISDVSVSVCVPLKPKTLNIDSVEYLQIRFLLDIISDNNIHDVIKSYIKEYNFIPLPLYLIPNSIELSNSYINDNDCYEYQLRHNSLYRVFNEEQFTYGGRFYGAKYQQYSEYMRSLIYINNEPTIELDYSGLHIRMLYHLEGVDYGQDPYDLFNGDQQLRNITKDACMNILNCDSRLKTERATFYKMVRSNGRFHKPPITYKEMQAVIDKVLDTHKLLSQHFFSVTGRTLQNIDSMIMEDIQKEFVEMEIPLLCIHDSCIVQQQYEGLLHDIMSQVYKRHVGFLPILK
jgi:hypothetical protein